MSLGHLNLTDSHRQTATDRLPQKQALSSGRSWARRLGGYLPSCTGSLAPSWGRKEGWAVASQQSPAGDRSRFTGPFWSTQDPTDMSRI